MLRSELRPVRPSVWPAIFITLAITLATVVGFAILVTHLREDDERAERLRTLKVEQQIPHDCVYATGALAEYGTLVDVWQPSKPTIP